MKLKVCNKHFSSEQMTRTTQFLSKINKIKTVQRFSVDIRGLLGVCLWNCKIFHLYKLKISMLHENEVCFELACTEFLSQFWLFSIFQEEFKIYKHFRILNWSKTMSDAGVRKGFDKKLLVSNNKNVNFYQTLWVWRFLTGSWKSLFDTNASQSHYFSVIFWL